MANSTVASFNTGAEIKQSFDSQNIAQYPRNPLAKLPLNKEIAFTTQPNAFVHIKYDKSDGTKGDTIAVLTTLSPKAIEMNVDDVVTMASNTAYVGKVIEEEIPTKKGTIWKKRSLELVVAHLHNKLNL
jgi:hypothetical protein